MFEDRDLLLERARPTSSGRSSAHLREDIVRAFEAVLSRGFADHRTWSDALSEAAPSVTSQLRAGIFVGVLEYINCAELPQLYQRECARRFVSPEKFVRHLVLRAFGYSIWAPLSKFRIPDLTLEGVVLPPIS